MSGAMPICKEVERQKEHINRLNNNPAEQELEIRKRLKLLHPDEKPTHGDQADPKTPANH